MKPSSAKAAAKRSEGRVYEFTPRDPNKGYLDTNLWIPKSKANSAAIKAGLTFDLSGSRLCLCYETDHHLVVPREYLAGKSPWFELVDLRPPVERVQYVNETGPRDSIQAEALSYLVKATSGILHLACGRGKTWLALKKAAKHGTPTLIVVYQTGTILQWQEQVEMFLGIKASVVQGDRQEWFDSPIVIASLSTLISRRDDLSLDVRERFGLIFFDECFPAGTLVDGRPIESLNTGDTILAFDEVSGRTTTSKVTRVFQKTTTRLLRICAGGRELLCTANHPFWTPKGWVVAGQLTTGGLIGDVGHHAKAQSIQVQSVFRASYPAHGNQGPNGLLRPLHSGQASGQEEAETGDLHSVWPSRQTGYQKPERPGGQGEGVLLRPVQGHEGLQGPLREDGADEQEVRLSPHACEESNATPRGSRKATHHTKGHGLETSGAWGQWDGPDRSPAAPRLRPGMGDGDSRIDGAEGQRMAHALHDRHRQSDPTDSNRGGWEVPQQHCDEGTGLEEGRVPTWARVDRIEILEHGHPDWPGGCASGCPVYNLEVERVHTYTANGFVVHNCHHLSAPEMSTTATMFFGDRIGLTATPYRDDGTEQVYFQHLGPIFYSNTEQDLAPEVHFIQLNTTLDLNTVKDRRGEISTGLLHAALGVIPGRVLTITDHVVRAYEAGRRSLVLGHSLDGLHALHKSIQEALPDVEVGLITGKVKQDKRRPMFVKCPIVVGTTSIASEALDAPKLDTVFFTTLFKTNRILVQGLGRVLRPEKDKKRPIAAFFEDKSIGPCRKWGRDLRADITTELGYDIKLV